MRSIAYVLTSLLVIGLAFWAYRENYATQQRLAESQRLQRAIGEAQVRLNVLRAEWAYLNRPDRLLELAEINFDRLGLLQLRPDQFGRVDEVAFPAPPTAETAPEPQLEITNPVDVSTMAGEQRP